MNKILTLVFAILLVACQAGGEIRIEDPWARAAGIGGTTGAFFIINNTGEADVLLSAASDIAEAVEVHQTIMEGDIMRMEMQQSVAIPSGTLAFQPGSYHVMLISLRETLNPGDEFSLTLTFEQAGPIVFNVEVRQP